jgi:hypothetical protein
MKKYQALDVDLYQTKAYWLVLELPNYWLSDIFTTLNSKLAAW